MLALVNLLMTSNECGVNIVHTEHPARFLNIESICQVGVGQSINKLACWSGIEFGCCWLVPCQYQLGRGMRTNIFNLVGECPLVRAGKFV